MAPQHERASDAGAAGFAWRGLVARVQPRTWLVLVAGLLWLLGAWHIAVAPLAPLTRLDLALADLRLALVCRPVATARQDIVTVDIDDASLRELGRWPWPRDRLAQLVDVLFDDDRIAALGVDLLLAEPDDQARVVRAALDRLEVLAHDDPGTRTQLARWRDDLAARADHDRRLARALEGRPVTLAYHFNHVPPRPPGARVTMHETAAAASAPTPGNPDLPEPITEPDVLPAGALAMAPWQGIEVPVAPLMHAAAGVGFINSLPDPDGELRTTPLVTSYGGAVYESFGLAVWRQWRHVGAVRPVTTRGAAGGPPRLTALQLTGLQGDMLRTLRVDERGAVTLPYRRALDAGSSPGTGRIRYIPAADVLRHRVGRSELEGRLVLLGSSAPGLTDLRSTPVHPALPGIEVHAQLLAGLEDGDLAVRPEGSAGFELLLLAAVLFAASFAVRRLAGPTALAALASIVLAVLVGDWAAMRLRGWTLPVAAPLTAALLLGLGGVVANYLWEWHARRSLAQLFGHYLPPERVRAMASDPDRFLDLASSAENRELTVLFCDLRGFTPMAERLAPERLREVLNLYFSRMSEIIHAHGGTLDKYIGDAVMAFWGAPVSDAEHARHAVEAARAMVQAVGPLNEALALRGLPALAPCLGLASGMVCVGDLGSRLRRSYTAVGDGVNLAARVEGLTRAWGVPLLVADATRRAAGDLPGCEWVEVDEVPVKGRSQPVTLFVPLEMQASTPQEITAFHEQLGLWRLAQAPLRGHHVGNSSATAAPAARAAARARLAELLQVRPAVPPLHALARYQLTRLGESNDSPSAPNPLPPEASSA